MTNQQQPRRWLYEDREGGRHWTAGETVMCGLARRAEGSFLQDLLDRLDTPDEFVNGRPAAERNFEDMVVVATFAGASWHLNAALTIYPIGVRPATNRYLGFRDPRSR